MEGGFPCAQSLMAPAVQRHALHPLPSPYPLAHLMVVVENPLVFVSFLVVAVFALFPAVAVFVFA